MNIRSKAQYGRKLIREQYQRRVDYQDYMQNVDKFEQAKNFSLVLNDNANNTIF